jgi:hypothetical protein
MIHASTLGSPDLYSYRDLYCQEVMLTIPHLTGQTVTWTATEGPVPCAPEITCKCKLPEAPPVVTKCWNDYDCHGQTLTWDYEEEGPHHCASTCTAELPSIAAPQVEATTTPVAAPTPDSTPVADTPHTDEPTPTRDGPVLQSVNAAANQGGSFVAAVLAAGVAVLV